MTRKRAKKLLMAMGFARNGAESILRSCRIRHEPNNEAVEYAACCLHRHLARRYRHITEHKWFIDALVENT